MTNAAPNGREAMLSRLKAALADAPVLPRRSAAVVSSMAECTDRDALLAAFLTNLDAAGVTHATAMTPQEAADALHAYLRQRGVRRVAAWDADALRQAAGFDVHAALRGLGLVVAVPVGERPCPDIAHAQAGITGAAAALAATGTVVVESGPGMPRSASIVPPAHVAFVPKRRILPDLAAFLASLPPDAPPPSAIHAISGVSSTGDIEFVYVRGAHGPMAVHVIVTAFP